MGAGTSHIGQAAAEVLQVIAESSRDLEQSLAAIAERAARHCRAYDAVVLLRHGETLEIAAHHGLIPVSFTSWPLTRQWTAGRAVIDMTPVHVHDLTTEGKEFPDGRTMALKQGHRTILSVPMMRNGEALGALTVCRLEVTPFSDEQVSLLVDFADHAAIAVENARLFEDARARNRELAATSDVLRVIARSPSDMQPALDAIAHSASGVCDAYDSMIFLRDGDVLRLKAHHGSIPTLGIGSELPVSRSSATGVALLEKRPVHVPDILAEAAQFPEGSEIARRLGHRTTLAVPLLRDDAAVGAILVRRRDVAAFSQRQIDLLTTFADQAVIAIENVRLFEEVQARNREVTEALQQQTATAEVLQVISRSAFDLQTVLDTLVASAARLCGADGALICRRQGEVYPVAATYGISAEFMDYMALHPVLPDRGSATGRAIMEGRPVQVQDVLSDPNYGRLDAQSIGGWRAILAVPLLREGSPIGTIALFHTTPRPFTPRQVELVATFADQAVIAIENVRLFEEVQARTEQLTEALQQQTATAEVLKAISHSTFNLQAVLQTLAESAAGLCKATYGGIMLRQDDRLTCNTLFGASKADLDDLRNRAYPIDRSTISGRVALSGKIEHILDVHADPDHGAEHLPWLRGTHGMMGVPLLREGRVEGVFFLSKQEPGAFTDRQADLVRTFADQAVIAIQNVRLFEEVQARTEELAEALQQQTATADVLKAISHSTFHLDAVLQTLVESAAGLCRATYGGIMLRKGDQLTCTTLFGSSKEDLDDLKSRSFPIDRSTTPTRVVQSGKIEHIPDVHTDPEIGREHLPWLSAVHGMMGVPLLREGKVEGAFFLGKPEPGAFTNRQAELVQTFADQAVIAIENARLFEEVQNRTRDLQESLDHQTATSELLEVIGRSTTDLQPVFDTLAESAVRLCEAERAFVFRFDGGVLRAAAWHGVSPDLVAMITAHPVRLGRQTIAARAGAERMTVHVHDVQADPEYTYFTKDVDPIRTVLAVPMLRGDELLGVTVIYRPEVRPFSPGQVALMETFSDQAVIAIENARLFEEVQARTRDLTESLQQQTATADVLKVISRSAFDLDAVLTTLIQSAATLCGVHQGVIYLRDGDVLKARAQFNCPAPFLELLKSTNIRANPKVFVGQTFATGEVVQIDDTDNTDILLGKAPEVGNFRAVLAVPMLREGRVEGVFALANRDPGAFNQRQIDLVTTFADQAVIAIENVRLFEEVQARTRELSESLDHQTATSELLEVIGRSTTDLQPVFGTLAESAVRLCEAERAVVFRFDGEVLRAVAWHNPSPGLITFIQANPLRLGRQSAAARAGLERRTIHIPDVQADPEYAYALQDLDPIRTVLAVPMLRGEVLLGVTVIYSIEVRPFTESHIALMQTFSDQAVIAIENARLFEEVKARTEELTEALQQQTATADVLKAISRSTFDLDAILNTLVESAARLSKSAKSSIFLRDGEMLRGGAFYGAASEEERAAQLAPMPIDRTTISGRVLLSGQPEFIEDTVTDPEYGYGPVRRWGQVRSMMSVPLLREGAAVGGFSVSRPEPGLYTTRECELITTFADQAVIAIENARLFEEVQNRTRDLARSVAEQKALGEVGQSISSTLDVQAVLSAILTHACHLASSGGGAIYTYDKSRGLFDLEAGHNTSEEVITEVRSHPVAIGEAIIGECAQRREPVQIEELSLASRHPIYDLHLKAGVRALLALPLIHHNEIVGALVVRRSKAGAFGPDTVNLLQAFAAQSAIAIQNARLFREMNEKSHQLEVASRHKSQFLANMSHELRTPLNSVLGFAEMLADGLYGELPDKAKVTLGRIQSNGKHLLGLINDVLDLSKIEAGQLTLAMEDYSIGQIVKSVVATTEPLARAKGLKLTATVADALPFGRGDERRISQVLLNLTGNAVKFTERGSIDITAIVREGVFEILVRDTGPGIAPEHQQRIFEEFQQIDGSSTRQKGGTGLGLAISKRIVELHGGRIELDSLVGAGSTFRVRLPIRAEKGAGAA